MQIKNRNGYNMHPYPGLTSNHLPVISFALTPRIILSNSMNKASADFRNVPVIPFSSTHWTAYSLGPYEMTFQKLQASCTNSDTPHKADTEMLSEHPPVTMLLST